ncbi:hypothetical protein F5Y06DRAFT_301436 [Hypoxylon sp. FL0890]|nr:hypothetical protein F5Y06DRAFT_301436 [Hypoxylon sp. FL0890]
MIGYIQSFDSAAGLKRTSFTGIVDIVSPVEITLIDGACLMIAQNTKRRVGLLTFLFLQVILVIVDPFPTKLVVPFLSFRLSIGKPKTQSKMPAENELNPPKAGGQFGFMAKIGATDAAVATLNDQPYLFTILVVVLVSLILECVLIWYIHFATLKPEQKKKKAPKDDKKPGGKPPAAR